MKLLLAVSLAGLFTCAVVWGQATAQIHGTVQDSSGSAVPGAQIKATQTDTGLSRTVNSDANGGYVVTNLPLGPYQVEVSKEGFTKYVQAGIVLQVNSDPAIDAKLNVGSVSQQVVVEANATQVETRSSGVGEVVQTQRIVELPLNGRVVTDLIALSGTAVQVGATRNSWFNNLPQISIAGQAYFGTGYSLDGANHLDYLTGTTLPVAFPDATQEFKVESSGQSAQRGEATSVSIVTRSGSNDIHGNLFEFLRNDGFGSAREYFSTTSSSLKRNQFGGTIGGPIKKNKLFYFGGFQGTILHSSPGNATDVVPTTQMLAGDWTTFAACNHETLRGGFVNNKISPSLFSGPAEYIVNKILPTIGTTPDQCGNITFNIPSEESDYQYVGKIDYQLNDQQSLFFRGLDTYEHTPNSQTLTSNLLASTAGETSQLAQSYSIGHTYVIGPTLVNSFRIGVDRTATTGFPTNAFSYCDAGVNLWCGSSPHAVGTNALRVIQGFTYTGTNSTTYWRMTSYGLNDDISWIKGAHQMTLGVGALVGRYGELNNFAGSGQFTFSGGVTGSGMGDFFLGVPSIFFQGLPNTASTRQNSVNLYFTDSWKINSHFTVNYGVRWEPFIPQTVANGQITDFDMNRFLAGTVSTVFHNAPPGFYFPGDPGFPDKSATYHKWAHFDPRGGIAWDPKGDGKTSVRASYAFGYAYIPGITREDQAGSNPWGGRANYNATSFADPYSATPGGNPYPYTVNPNVIFTPGGQFLASPYDLPTPTTYSWNVALQHQFGASWVASATYIGSRVQHLYVNVPINYGQIVGPIEATGCAVTATNCTSSGRASNLQARRVLSLLNPNAGVYVGNMDAWDASGYQNYQGGLFSVQKRFSQGVSMTANWTWSHCIGVFQGFNSKPEETVTVPNNPTFDRGNCDSDRRNIVNITAVALTPQFSNRMLRIIGSGWQVAGIYRFTSGTPLAIQDGVDNSLTGINHQRPNVVDPANVYTGHSGPSVPYLNLNAFALPPTGAPFGNLGWNAIVSPTYWDMDLAVSRQFALTERQKLELRADAFNITNSFVTQVSGAQQSGIGTGSPGTPTSPAYDTINSGGLFGLNNGFAQPTRKIQFALKYIF
jgi:Carboxypeptidase regulatory-like domain